MPHADVLVLEEHAIVVADAGEELRVEFLGDRVQAFVAAVDEDPHEHLARRRHADALVQRHRDALAHQRGILPEVVEHERLVARERPARGVPVEVHAQAELGGVATPESARPDPDVAHLDAAILEVGRVVRVLRGAGAQLREVPAVDRQLHVAHAVLLEDVDALGAVPGQQVL